MAIFSNEPQVAPSSDIFVMHNFNKYKTFQRVLIFLNAGLIFTLIILVFVNISYYLKDNRIGQPVYTWTPIDNTHPKIAPDGTLNLSLDSRSPLINQLAVVYQFSGNIVQLKEIPEGKEIITDIKDLQLPRFIVQPQWTKIYYGTDDYNYSAVVTPNELRVGQKIRLNIFYELRKKVWVLRAVFIM